MEKKYIIEEKSKVYKRPKEPKPEDYWDIKETAKDRAERVYLYSEVK